jgi:hypothetical protein
MTPLYGFVYLFLFAISLILSHVAFRDGSVTWLQQHLTTFMLVRMIGGVLPLFIFVAAIPCDPSLYVALAQISSLLVVSITLNEVLAMRPNAKHNIETFTHWLSETIRKSFR